MKIDELPSEISEPLWRLISYYSDNQTTLKEREYAEQNIADSIADKIRDVSEFYFRKGIKVGRVVGYFKDRPITVQSLADQLDDNNSDYWLSIIAFLRTAHIESGGDGDAAAFDAIAAEARRIAMDRIPF